MPNRLTDLMDALLGRNLPSPPPAMQPDPISMMAPQPTVPNLPAMKDFPRSEKTKFYMTDPQMLQRMGLGPRTLGIYDRETNQAFSGVYDPQTVAHEGGHGLWDAIGPDKFSKTGIEIQREWERLHGEALNNILDNIKAGRNYNMDQSNPFIQYSDDPAHSFAESYGLYVTKPKKMKIAYPQEYKFFQDLENNKKKRK